MYIPLFITSDLSASILLASIYLISSMVTMIQQMKEAIENMGKHHDDNDTINDDAEENGLEDDDNFDVFQNNLDVTTEADELCMDVLNKLTCRGKDIFQLLMGKAWDQDLDEDDNQYTNTLMELIRSSS